MFLLSSEVTNVTLLPSNSNPLRREMKSFVFGASNFKSSRTITLSSLIEVERTDFLATALTFLDCSYNDLTSLNLNNTTALTKLFCENNDNT